MENLVIRFWEGFWVGDSGFILKVFVFFFCCCIIGVFIRVFFFRLVGGVRKDFLRRLLFR